jgi:hypothetical protein
MSDNSLADAFDQIFEWFDEAVTNTAGEPFPERAVSIALEMTVEWASYVADALSVPGAAPNPPPATPSQPDPPDAGAGDKSGGPTSSADDIGGDDGGGDFPGGDDSGDDNSGDSAVV